MRCSQCGAKLQKGSWYCPKCGTELSPSEQEQSAKKKRVGRNFVLIFSLCLLIPNLICFAANTVSGITYFWAGYVILVSAFIWMCVCFPFLRFGNLTVKMGLCGLDVLMFIFVIAALNHGFGWFFRYAFPICLTLVILMLIMAELIRSRRVRGLHIPSLSFAAVMLFLNAIDLIVHINNGIFMIRWSLITDAVFFSLILLFEGIAYVVKHKND